MKKSQRVKRVLGSVLLAGALIGLSACGTQGSGGSKEDSKVLTISVDKGYEKYVNAIKGDFEKKNDVKIKVVKKRYVRSARCTFFRWPSRKSA